MKSVIYEFDQVIYPFKLLVSKDFDAKELGGMYYCIDDDENLIDSPGEFLSKSFVLSAYYRTFVSRQLQYGNALKRGTLSPWTLGSIVAQ